MKVLSQLDETGDMMWATSSDSQASMSCKRCVCRMTGLEGGGCHPGNPHRVRQTHDPPPYKFGRVLLKPVCLIPWPFLIG